MDTPAAMAMAMAMVLSLLLYSSAEGRLLNFRAKPPHDSAVASARWLASENSWGVLNTISSDLGGAPFGNVVSYSDGLPEQGKGNPYFYLTALDPTAGNALKDPRASFSVSEYPVGTCGKTDPENPTCGKMTLTGKLGLLEDEADEAKFAREALFKKHPEMRDWPKDHGFRVFKLTIEDVFLINWYGGRKPITVEEYLSFKP